MISGQYHRVLLPIELISDNKKKSVSAYWHENKYQMVIVWRKGRSKDEQPTPIGWSCRIVGLKAEDMESKEWALEMWIQDEFLPYIEKGIIRISWEESEMGHVFPFLGKVSVNTKAYLDRAYPDIFLHSREARHFEFEQVVEETEAEAAERKKKEVMEGRENSHRKYIT